MFIRVSGWSRWLIQAGLTIITAIFLMPLYEMFKTSFRGEGLGNYKAVLEIPLVPRFIWNSFFITMCTILIVFIATTFAAYAFSKLELKGKGFLFNAVLIGLMIPGASLTVPLFTTVKNLHLFNNYFAVILPLAAILMPFTLMLMRGFMEEIPNALLEAARIDGCTTLSAFWYLILPLTKPIAIVVVLWCFFNSWNEYFFPMLFMQDDSMRTLTQVPQFFKSARMFDTGKTFATLVLISLPVMVLYLFLQRHFENGMTSGSIK